jgi:glutaredoxin
MFTIISKPDCPWCEKALDVLIYNNFHFSKFDVPSKPWMRTLLKKAGLTTVPQIFHDDKYVGGYDDLVTYLKETFNDSYQLSFEFEPQHPRSHGD